MGVSFKELKDSYPRQSREDLFKAFGGDWPHLIDDKDNFGNTCAVRMSVALRGAGLKIGSEFSEAMDNDGKALVIKVKTLEILVTELFGKWTWGMSKNPGTMIISDDLPKYQGIIAYHADWKTATGHFDLWDKDHFVGSGNFDDIQDGFDIAIWKL